jgi:hypothetical protein
MEKVKYINTVGTDMVEARQDFKLSLRKQKMDDYFMTKRLAEMKLRNSLKSNMEINPDMLVLSAEIRNVQINDTVILFNLEQLDDFY